MNWQEHISSNPKIMFGKLVIKGTRLPIDLILEKMAAGETMDDLLLDYPHISKEDIFAVLQFAAENINAASVYPIAV